MKISFRPAVLAIAVLAVALPAPGQDIERAKEIVSGKCFLCHGIDGESSTELYPRLAGQHRLYLEKQLKDFRDGRRTGGGMEKMAEGLRDEEIAGLAVYFSARKADPTPAADAARASTGRELYRTGSPGAGWPACASCHGVNGAGTQNLPRLAGQLPAYVARQLRNFGNRTRNNDNEVMHDIAARLSEGEIRALAAFLGELE